MRFKIDDIDLQTISLGLLVVALLVTGFNSFQLAGMTSTSSGPITINVLAAPAGSTGTVSLSADAASTTEVVALDGIDIIPKGIPEFYGEELSISFDDVTAANPQSANATIKVLGDLDRTMELTGADLERYIEVLYTLEGGISCEYCCGAKSIIFENGASACGCAHSYAMRGLTKYLITEHSDDFTDAELLNEVAKWKVLFFPTQMTAKAEIMAEQGIEVNYINVGSNNNRGIEKSTGGSGGGMVGGC
ncbi:MAG: hypothetical protein GOV15_00785 [Candidatus Diapherotrites archaeon]|nr:hypothetical protein [Candidatus Diapherotrites archaeon]